MKKNQDKSISTIILFLSGLAIIWWFYNYYLSPNNQGVVEVYNLKTIVSWGAKNSDLLIIIYIFLKRYILERIFIFRTNFFNPIDTF